MTLMYNFQALNQAFNSLYNSKIDLKAPYFKTFLMVLPTESFTGLKILNIPEINFIITFCQKLVKIKTSVSFKNFFLLCLAVTLFFVKKADCGFPSLADGSSMDYFYFKSSNDSFPFELQWQLLVPWLWLHRNTHSHRSFTTDPLCTTLQRKPHVIDQGSGDWEGHL